MLILRNSLFIFLLVACICGCGQGDDSQYRQSVAAKRMQLNEEFFDPARSPLDSSLFAHFKGLKFFPIDADYKVSASFEPITDTSVFDLPHSHQRTKPYRNYGKLRFELKGKSYELFLLEAATKKPGYEDYLLLSFCDQTNNAETYGGGRYIDMEKPSAPAAKMEIDFNLAYNPYCAYSSAYTCPIPPKENFIDTRVEAGMKYEHIE